MTKDATQKPNNKVQENSQGFYFPAWAIHVAKTAKVIKKSYSKPFIKDGRHKVRVTEREVKIHVAKTVNDAKAHIKENHGIDVDKDIPPPKIDS